MAPVMLSAQMAKADATRAKPVRGMPTGFELFRDSFDVLERDGSPLRAATDVGVETGGKRTAPKGQNLDYAAFLSVPPST